MALLEGAYTEDGRREFFKRAVHELRANPQFEAVALSDRLQMTFAGGGQYEVDGQNYLTDRDRPRGNFESISDNYFSTLGLKILEGRDFTIDDADSKQSVAIVNASFARRHWGNQSALGHQVRIFNPGQPQQWRTIVGVVPDTLMQGPFDQQTENAGFYMPLLGAQPATQFCTIIVRPRAGQNAETLGPSLSKAVTQLDSDLPIYFPGTPARLHNAFLAGNRIIANLFVIFGVVAFVLSAVGSLWRDEFFGEPTHPGIRNSNGARRGRSADFQNGDATGRMAARHWSCARRGWRGVAARSLGRSCVEKYFVQGQRARSNHLFRRHGTAHARGRDFLFRSRASRDARRSGGCASLRMNHMNRLASMLAEIRFALRQLRKSPGFTLIAVLTLALGIGLNTAIFSLINDLFLRGLPFKEPQRLVHMYSNARERNLLELAISVPRFEHYRDSQTIFDGFGAENVSAFTLTGLGDAVQVLGGQVTSNYFDVLGVRPIRGRNFLPEEEKTADVAMVTENFWRKRLGGDPNVIGRGITLNGAPHTIVGVLPNLPFSWVGPAAEVWTTKPFEIAGISYERIMRGSGVLRVVGRLNPGMTLEQARAALPPLEQSYRARYPDKIDSSSVMTLKTLAEDTTGNLRPAFVILLTAVAFVLLIACSNVANLLLVRFSGRRREIALRMAIGASRRSVVRLFIFESLLVSVIAGIAGALLAWYVVPMVPKMAANFLPFDPDTRVQLSVGVLGFTIVMSILTGVAMGIYPALQTSRADLVGGLKEGGRGTSGSAQQLRRSANS